MSNVTSGVKIYTESPTLLQYQPKKEFTQEDTPYLTQKRHQLPAIESNPSIPEALNAIFPPKIWEEDGQRFIQYVSQEPATREKARDLFKALDEKIKERQAREKGICIRKQIQTEAGKEDLKNRLLLLEDRKKELIKKKSQLDNKLKAFDKIIAERNQIETAKREEQSAFLRQQNENLDKFLKSIDGGKS